VDTCRICIGYGYVSDVSTEYPKKEKKKNGYWGRYVLATIAHYRIRFGPAEAGQRRLRLSGKKERSGGGVDRAGRWTAGGSGGRGGWHVDPVLRRTAGGSSDRGGRHVDQAPRQTACGSGSRDGRAPFPCAACHPQLAAPARSLDPWRRALSLTRERERELTRERERERCGHAMLGEKRSAALR
jgi:hypothetical protein